MSNFQQPGQKIAWLERRLNALESMVRKVISPNGITSSGTSGGAATVGVLEVHTHLGTGEGGTLDCKGTSSIGTASTSATITHGCGFTPTISQITIIPSINTTVPVGMIWVDTIGTATFNVNCAGTPGASTLIFGWRVSPT